MLSMSANKGDVACSDKGVEHKDEYFQRTKESTRVPMRAYRKSESSLKVCDTLHNPCFVLQRGSRGTFYFPVHSVGQSHIAVSVEDHIALPSHF